MITVPVTMLVEQEIIRTLGTILFYNVWIYTRKWVSLLHISIHLSYLLFWWILFWLWAVQFNNKLILSNCVLISAKFERERSLIRNFAIKTKDGYKRYQLEKRRILKVSRYTCIISFFFWGEGDYLNLLLKPLSFLIKLGVIYSLLIWSRRWSKLPYTCWVVYLLSFASPVTTCRGRTHIPS
jgi:hypothetical protein